MLTKRLTSRINYKYGINVNTKSSLAVLRPLKQLRLEHRFKKAINTRQRALHTINNNPLHDLSQSRRTRDGSAVRGAGACDCQRTKACTRDHCVRTTDKTVVESARAFAPSESVIARRDAANANTEQGCPSSPHRSLSSTYAMAIRYIEIRETVNCIILIDLQSC